MGSQLVILTTDMKVFLCISSLVVATSASLAGALVGGHGIVGGHGLVGGHAVVGGQSSHQSVSKPYQGEARTTSQAKAFGSPIASVSSSDSVSNTAQAGLASHLGQGVIG